jgi:hypothetical protein
MTRRRSPAVSSAARALWSFGAARLSRRPVGVTMAMPPSRSCNISVIPFHPKVDPAEGAPFYHRLPPEAGHGRGPTFSKAALYLRMSEPEDEDRLRRAVPEGRRLGVRAARDPVRTGAVHRWRCGSLATPRTRATRRRTRSSGRTSGWTRSTRRAGFFSWIYRIAVNESLNLRRTQRPHEPLPPRSSPSGSVVDGVEARELSERVQAALMTLSHEQREGGGDAASSPICPTKRSPIRSTSRKRR